MIDRAVRQMLWYHAASWFFILPYLLLHAWISLMDACFAGDHLDSNVRTVMQENEPHSHLD